MARVAIHLLRVIRTKSQREWWVIGDHATDTEDLFKNPPYHNKHIAIREYEQAKDVEVYKFTQYKAMTQAEAAMTATDIILKNVKGETDAK